MNRCDLRGIPQDNANDFETISRSTLHRTFCRVRLPVTLPPRYLPSSPPLTSRNLSRLLVYKIHTRYICFPVKSLLSQFLYFRSTIFFISTKSLYSYVICCDKFNDDLLFLLNFTGHVIICYRQNVSFLLYLLHDLANTVS